MTSQGPQESSPDQHQSSLIDKLLKFGLRVFILALETVRHSMGDKQLRLLCRIAPKVQYDTVYCGLYLDKPSHSVIQSTMLRKTTREIIHSV